MPTLSGRSSVRQGRFSETRRSPRRSLRKANEKASELQDKLDAQATVTANLYQENIELKKKANRRQRNRLAVLTGGADPDN
jgi:hypothetical protein